MRKKIKGGTINLILGIVFMTLLVASLHYSFELFHYSRKVYAIILLILMPIPWSQLVLYAMGKRTIGHIIADKINKKYNDKDTDIK